MKIDEFIRKRDTLSNVANRVRKHKKKLKIILEEGRSNRIRTYCGLEDKINSSLRKFDINT